VTETATSANPMLQQVALMIRASMTGDLSQFGEGWQIGYDETEGAGTVRMVPLSRRARKYIDSITLRFDLENMRMMRSSRMMTLSPAGTVYSSAMALVLS